MDVPHISSHRLELVPLSPALMAVLEDRRDEAAALLGAAIPGAWPDADDERFLRRRLEQLRRDPNAQRWLERALVGREPERVMAGHARFHGEPGGSGAGKPRALEATRRTPCSPRTRASWSGAP